MLAALGAIFSRYGASVDMGRAVRRVSADGTIVPGPVTPDMMAQGRGLSVVVEIKAGFPSCARARQKIFEQLKKYDCWLAGWMEKDVDRHDIAAATLPQNAVEMSNYLNSKAGSDGARFQTRCAWQSLLGSRGRGVVFCQGRVGMPHKPRPMLVDEARHRDQHPLRPARL